MRKTIKISFEEDDPRYVFLLDYGKRLTTRNGASVVVMMMVDEILGSTPFKGFSTRLAESTSVQKKSVELQPAKKLSTEHVEKQPPQTDLLSAIEDFQSKLQGL